MMKAGPNRLEINTIKKLEAEGYNSATISRLMMIEEQPIKNFMKDPDGGASYEEVQAARGTGHSAAMEALKEENENLKVQIGLIQKRNDNLEAKIIEIEEAAAAAEEAEANKTTKKATKKSA